MKYSVKVEDDFTLDRVVITMRNMYANRTMRNGPSRKAKGRYNECLQKEEDGVLVPADTCTPDEDGILEGLYDCGITDEDHEELSACLAVNPSAIIDLTLGENSLSSLPEGLFADMGSLKDLDLGWMSLEELPEGLFDDVPKLQTLYMGEQNNGLSELPVGLFDGLTKLRILGLGTNNISTLPAGIFSTNTRLSRIDLGENPVTSLPETLFNGLENLHQIGMTQSNQPGPDDNDGGLHITELPAGLFKGLWTLKRVYFRGNLLTTLPEGIFADNMKIKEIDFSNNELVELPESTFLNLPFLEELDLTGNVDLQCKYEVDDSASEEDIEWPEHLDELSVGECL
eukprot:jgi/Undpi1/5193/HiC_scaffold_2.g00476.m1